MADPVFEIFKDDAGRYYFHLKAGNGEKILESQTYPEHDSSVMNLFHITLIRQSFARLRVSKRAIGRVVRAWSLRDPAKRWVQDHREIRLGAMSTVHPVAENSREERLRRQRHVDNAVHSLALEGLTVSDEDIAAAAEYVDGAITAEEFVERGLAQLTVI
jgi:uncharacterized protein YegP (UPF0339 family)